MPQLDTSTYFSQYIYLVFSFLITYYFVASFLIPNTVSILKLRQKLSTRSKTQISPQNQRVTKLSAPETAIEKYSIVSNFNRLGWKASSLDSNSICNLKLAYCFNTQKAIQLSTSLKLRHAVINNIFY